jgi:hypothetical protein
VQWHFFLLENSDLWESTTEMPLAPHLLSGTSVHGFFYLSQLSLYGLDVVGLSVFHPHSSADDPPAFLHFFPLSVHVA